MTPRGHRGFSTGARARRSDAQHKLFGRDAETQIRTGRFNIEAELRKSLKSAIDECGASREVIAVEMTRLCEGDHGLKVTKAHLDAWTAASRSPWKLPVSGLLAFIEATGSRWLLARLAFEIGLHVCDDETMRLAKIGKLHEDLDRLQRQLDTLKRPNGGAA